MPKKFDSIDNRKKGNAKRLFNLRKALGLSQKEIADAFNVKPGTVALWELGERKISGPALRLVEIYESNMSQYFPKDVRS